MQIFNFSTFVYSLVFCAPVWGSRFVRDLDALTSPTVENLDLDTQLVSLTPPDSGVNVQDSTQIVTTPDSGQNVQDSKQIIKPSRFWDHPELEEPPEEKFKCDKGIHVCCLDPSEPQILPNGENNICQEWRLEPFSTVCDPIIPVGGSQIPIEACCGSISFNDHEDIQFGPRVRTDERHVLGRAQDCGPIQRQREAETNSDIVDFLRALDVWGAQPIPLGEYLRAIFGFDRGVNP
ncbi:hypothetical protein MMC07_000922 [Pseudocyphellaria aurata]|nr:hypothetical protein [Pseudocyphellaria aurata]